MEGKTEDKFVLFLNCPLKVCEARILERAKTSGRSDDNIGADLTIERYDKYNICNTFIASVGF